MIDPKSHKEFHHSARRSADEIGLRRVVAFGRTARFSLNVEVRPRRASSFGSQLLNRKDEAREAFIRAASLTDDPALREYLFQRSADEAGLET